MNEPTDPRRLVADAAAALKIEEPPSFTWFGERTFRMRRGLRRQLSPDSADALLVRLVEQHLYQNFYTLGGAQPLRRMPYLVDSALDERAFRQALAAANRGHGHWEPGWNVVALRGPDAVIERNGLRLLASTAELAQKRVDPDAALVVGEVVELFRPPSLPAISPGFYMASGDRPLPPGRILRLYWNIVPRAAPELMDRITGRLNAKGVPFRFKVLDSPQAFLRADAAVLYLPHDFVAAAAPSLHATHSELAGLMDPWTPALTLSLARGLGAAEDPGNGESFGLSRCRLIALGLRDPCRTGTKSASGRIDAIAAQFEAVGLSLAAPHLDTAETTGWTESFRGWNTAAKRRSGRGSPDAAALSESIADGILKRAISHSGQCNWIGAVNESTAELRPRRFAPLNGSLYSGTSGLALLFAEMAYATGEKRFRAAALGALRHAVAQAWADEDAQVTSAFTGAVGIAWAAACAGRLLDCDEAREAAKTLLLSSASRLAIEPESDVLVGAAGGALALLSLSRLGYREAAEPLLVRCGERIIAAAEQRDDQWVWPTETAPRRQPLTGFSHGAAGIAAALMALYCHGGDPLHADAAHGALVYERRLFDSAEGNWPDLRDAVPARAPRFSTYWCHGAPGIALARLMMSEMQDDPILREEAATGFTTTARQIAGTSQSPSEAHCLCHGLPGNAHILAVGLARMGLAPPDWRSSYEDAVAALLEDYTARHGRNVEDSGMPGLMLGEGGLAFFFLAASRGAMTRILELHEGVAPAGDR